MLTKAISYLKKKKEFLAIVCNTRFQLCNWDLICFHRHSFSTNCWIPPFKTDKSINSFALLHNQRENQLNQLTVNCLPPSLPSSHPSYTTILDNTGFSCTQSCSGCWSLCQLSLVEGVTPWTSHWILAGSHWLATIRTCASERFRVVPIHFKCMREEAGAPRENQGRQAQGEHASSTQEGPRPGDETCYLLAVKRQC